LRQQQDAFIKNRNQNSSEMGAYYFGSIALGVGAEVLGAAALAGGARLLSGARTIAPKGIGTAESSFSYGTKINKQLEKRGWDNGKIDSTIARPHATSPATNKANGGDATAFFNKDGSYVVRDNKAGEIIQVSNRNDPNWVPDPTITNPYRRK
jgi:hypothetical protein